MFLNTVDDYLQSFLIVEANKKFNIYNPKNKFPTEIRYGSYCRIMGYYTEVQAVLDDYLYNVKGFSEELIETKRIKEDVRNTIVNEIKNCNPVLVSCRDKKGRGHIFIIYDYDCGTGEIYGNSLTMEGYNHMRISSAYKKIEYAIVLKYNN